MAGPTGHQSLTTPPHNLTGSSGFDVLVIGSGLAGVASALRLADAGLSVGLLAPRIEGPSASVWAQGGIAAALGPGDDPAQHAADTLQAGAGLCHASVVALVTRRAPPAIRWLQRHGVAFARAGADDEPDDSVSRCGLHLAREGGHGRRRIVHVGDATGEAVISTLLEHVHAHQAIQLLDRHIVLELLTVRTGGASAARRCVGVRALDLERARSTVLHAGAVVLATGGAARLWKTATHPSGAAGDGIALAWRAGCAVANLEFMQFHPTCLYHPSGQPLLISEAVRGEGGRLRLPDGHAFMSAYDARGELAPRDIVSRAIHHEMHRHGLDCVYLDVTHLPARRIRRLFPHIVARLAELGIDMTRTPVPVAPAAHFSCGGIVTDAHAATTLPGLYALGECAHTGLHGANRLASNSLLECLVFAETMCERLPAALADRPPAQPAAQPARTGAAPAATTATGAAPLAEWRAALQRSMWHNVGIERCDAGLAAAAEQIAAIAVRLDALADGEPPNLELVELRNMALVAALTVHSARLRRESRGAHFNRDCPGQLDRAADTVLDGSDPNNRLFQKVFLRKSAQE